MASSGQKPVAPFVLSLLSGVFIALGGIISSLWISYWPMGWMGSMMNWWSGSTATFGMMGFIMGIVGIIFGIIVIISAIMLYRDPKQHELWGALIVVFSVISIVSGMGGMGIGLALGLIGGVLAIVWKP